MQAIDNVYWGVCFSFTIVAPHPPALSPASANDSTMESLLRIE